MQLHVVCEDTRDHTTQEVVLQPEGSIVLGRDRSSPLVLEHEAISREHLVLSRDGNHLTLSDVSANGASLNGAAMPEKKRVVLEGGEVIDIPGYRLVLTLLDQTPADETPVRSRMATLSPLRGFWRSLSTTEILAFLLALLALFLVVLYLVY